MMAKNSFVLYTEYMKHFELLTLEQRGLLITAIMHYQSGVELPDMDPATRMAFSFISSALDANNEKYTKTVEARKEAGRKSAEAKKAKSDFVEQNATKSTNAEFVESKSTKQTVYVSDTDTVSVTDTDTVSVKKNNNARAKHSRLSDKELESEFDDVWERYPRKDGRKEALELYKKDRRDGVDKSEFDLGIARYNAYLKVVGSEYVQMGSTFFRKRSWQNEWKPRGEPEKNKQAALKEWLASKGGVT